MNPQDYFGSPEFNLDSAVNMADVTLTVEKALSTGYVVDPASMVDGGALRVESLQTELVMATHREESAAFWKAAPKLKARSVVEQYTKVTNIGDSQFYTEGGLPEIYADSLKREFELVKFIGTVGQVSGVIEVVDQIKPAVATETMLKTLSMVRALDDKCWNGDASINDLEFNGILRQHYTKHSNLNDGILDLRGKKLTLEILNRTFEVLKDYYGYGPYQIWSDFSAKSGFYEECIKNKNFFVNAGGTDIRGVGIGQAIETAHGRMPWNTDVFLKPKGYPYISPVTGDFAATSTLAPLPPTVSAQSASSANDTAFEVPPGTYEYCITAFNSFGESAPSEQSSVMVATGKKVTWTIVDASIGTDRAAKGYAIYRRDAAKDLKTDYQFVRRISISAAKQDTGEFLPGCSTVSVLEWDPAQCFAIYQLLPLMRIPLARISDSTRWLQKAYLTPIVKNANHIRVIRNCGGIAWE